MDANSWSAGFQPASHNSCTSFSEPARRRRYKPMRSLIVLMTFILLPVLQAQEYKVEVTTVNVWIKIIDKDGKPLEGLTQQDFEIYEDDHRMDPTCFEEVKQEILETEAPPAESSAPQSKEAARKFVIFLDLFNTSPAEYLKVQPKLVEFLDQVSSNGFELMIAGVTAQGKLGVMQQFSRDTNHAKALLEHLQANAGRDQRVIQNERDLIDVVDSGPEGITTAFGLARTLSRQEMELSRFSLSALRSFSDYVAQLKSQEHLIILVVSGGFDSDPGRRYYEILYRITGGEPNPVTMPESIRNTDFSIPNEVKSTIGRLNRSNITAYAINTRGAYVGGADPSRNDSRLFTNDPTLLQDYQDSVARIATETGGVFFQNSTNFQRGFDKILDDLKNQYLICYISPPHKKPGEYHNIKVVVKREGVKLRHRQGYVD